MTGTPIETLMSFEAAKEEFERLMTDQYVRDEFLKLAADDPACSAAFKAMEYNRLPLASGLLIALRHTVAERNRLRELVLDYTHPLPITITKP